MKMRRMNGRISSTLLVGLVPIALAEAFDGKSGVSAAGSLGSILVFNLIGTAAYAMRPAFVLSRIATDRGIFAQSFVHTDAQHVIANLVPLTLAWPYSCEGIGTEKTLAVYVTGAVVPFALARRGMSTISTITTSTTVGSSAAVSAVIASVLSSTDFGPLLAPFGAVGLLATNFFLSWRYRHDPIDHWMHLQGTVVGMSCTLLSQVSSWVRSHEPNGR